MRSWILIIFSLIISCGINLSKSYTTKLIKVEVENIPNLIKFENVKVIDTKEGPKIIGKVHHIGIKHITGITIIAEFYDNQENFICIEKTQTLPKSLPYKKRKIAKFKILTPADPYIKKCKLKIKYQQIY